MRTYDFVAHRARARSTSGLACLTEPVDDLDGIFLEARDDFSWHPGMMLADATLQVPFLADLVTMADPDLAVLVPGLPQADRPALPVLHPRELLPAARRVRPVLPVGCCADRRRSASAPACRRVEHDGEAYVITARLRTATPRRTGRAALVLGIGTAAARAAAVRGLGGPDAPHRRLPDRQGARCRRSGSITIVGSGQSAAEIYLDLLEDIDAHGYELTWVTRSPRFFPMEYTKLTLEMTSPEYTAYFQALPLETRDRARCASSAALQGHQRRPGRHDLRHALPQAGARRGAHARCSPTPSCPARRGTGERCVRPRAAPRPSSDEPFALTTEGLVLATGYAAARAGVPRADRATGSAGTSGAATPWRPATRSTTQRRDLRAERRGAHARARRARPRHGRLPQLDHRRAMAGREVYPVEERIAFQEFGVPSPDGGAGMTTSSLFARATRLGRITLEPVDVDRDAATLHAWVTHPRSRLLGHAGRHASTTSARRTPASPPTRTTTPGSAGSTASRRSSPRRTTRRAASSHGATSARRATSACTCWSHRRPTGRATASPPRSSAP